MIAPDQIKKLEALVLEAAKSLKETRRENAKLAKINRALERENEDIKEQLRRLSSYPVKHRRLRERLEKIARKLEKIGA